MARPIDKHLTVDEIDLLLRAGRGGVPSPAAAASPDDEFKEIREHVAVCDGCSERMRAHKSAEAGLAALRLREPEVRGAACPPEERWASLAVNLPTPEEAEELLNHAVQCDHCGPMLRSVTEDFTNELTPEEEQVIAQLESAKDGWTRELAEKMNAAAKQTAKQATPENNLRLDTRASPLRWPRWALVTAAIVLLGVVVGRWMKPGTANTEQLLADAYTEQRTLELRIPGARYGPLRIERGPAGSQLSRPPALLEAEAMIARKLAEHPNDPYWLGERGRAELLDWQYAAAIKSFTRALEARPDAPDLERDLATAYFQRAEAEDRAIDYGTAIKLLGQTLAKQPDDPVALFNRAIAEERMFLYHEAIGDWERYLKVDPKSEWAGEADRRRSELREKIKAHEKPSAMLRKDPAAAAPLLRARAESKGDGAAGWPDSLDEEYLDIAIKDWLPRLYLSAGSGWERNSAVWDATRELAEVLRVHHHDRWLSDLLTTPPTHPYMAGGAELSRAVKANAEGDPADGEAAARKAERDFRAAGSSAGSLRARLEVVYSLHREQKGDWCIRAAQPLEMELRGRGYAWAENQLDLEQRVCWMMIDDFGNANQALRRALQSFPHNAYASLYLRSLGFASAMDLAEGNMAGAWAEARAGLARYWQGTYPPVRAYQFYSDLAQTAEDTGDWQLAASLWPEAVHYTSPAQYPLQRALAQFKLATALGAAGRTQQATQEFERANQEFAALARTETTSVYEADGEISLAGLEVERGEFERALERLERERPAIAGIASYTLPLHFYQTLGEIYLNRGNTQRAEEALVRAVDIAEQGVKSLPSDAERLNWDVETGRAYRLLVELYYRQRKDPDGAFEVWEWYRGAPLRSATSKPMAAREGMSTRFTTSAGSTGNQWKFRPAKLEELRRCFSPSRGETLLSYAQLPEGLIVWRLDERGIDSAWVPVSARELERVARRFGEECADPASSLLSLQRDSRTLYDWLIAPLAMRLEAGRTLIIEPDGAISQIPFGALMDAAAQYLGTRYALVTSPGLAYQQRLRSSPAFTRLQRALVVSAPTLPADLAAGFPPLAAAGREAGAVAAKFREARLLGGKSATFEAIERELPQAEIFHFAGHAFSTAGRSGLLLAGSQGASSAGILEATSLQTSQVRQCELVVLSACLTATDEHGLVNPDSLVRAFLRAGVPHVVASRWSVDSESAAEFMELFYASLLSGQSVPGALQSASQELRTRSAKAHPYYWAVFDAYGHW